ncbi:hypothetical protein HCH16_11740 [Staphylococcus pettenkoferi]|uniref:hypothetical protein n=1 Tax=Staphylococcus pettenkoferi TaxID=170573 RepID=UPI001C8CBF13|nr:hypothetical protein [Staphylococcus pettenkoferi]MBX8994548.1 hypothetical protein [Staphylococcus pettenkoferi]
MRKIFYAFFIIIILVFCYICLNFLFFDNWVSYSSEKQINTYIDNHKKGHLLDISDDKKTYKFLKSTDSISIKLKSDNQGSGNQGYYLVEINNKPAKLFVDIKYGFIPEKTHIKNIKVDK